MEKARSTYLGDGQKAAVNHGGKETRHSRAGPAFSCPTGYSIFYKEPYFFLKYFEI